MTVTVTGPDTFGIVMVVETLALVDVRVHKRPFVYLAETG